MIIVAGDFQDRSILRSASNYDRRGCAESGDNKPYAIEREIEDMDALVEESGGSAFVFGGSSGGVLTRDAATHDSNITKLAICEPPFVVDNSRDTIPENMVNLLKDTIAP